MSIRVTTTRLIRIEPRASTCQAHRGGWSDRRRRPTPTHTIDPIAPWADQPGSSSQWCQNADVSRTRTLRLLLIATTVAGVSLPHLLVGELAGSLPSMVIGIAVGLGCLRLALGGRSQRSRTLGALGIAVAALAPLTAYLAQEAAEHEPGLEAAHAEPNLLVMIGAQAPLIILAFIAVRLLVNVVRTVVGVLRRSVEQPRSPRNASVRTPSPAAVLPGRVALLSSNGQRAPPGIRVPHRLAPLG